MIWVLLASLANAQWHETKIKDDFNGIAVVGVALRQWRPTDEVFFVIEERTYLTNPEKHTLSLAVWDCLNASCSSVSLQGGGPHRLENDLRHDQYLHPSMAIKRANPTAPREVEVAMRGRWQNCDGGIYSLSSATANVTKYLDVVSRFWDTDDGYTAAGLIRADTSDATCEDSTRSFARFDSDHDLHVAYDWAETPDVSSGPGFVEPDIFISEYSTHTMVDRYVGDDGLRYGPTFDFYRDDNDDQHRAVVFHDTTEDTMVDFLDFSGVVDVAFGSTSTAVQYPSIDVEADRIHMVNTDDENDLYYRTCTKTSNADCNDSADWTLDVLANDAKEASIVADGKRLFIVFSEDGVVKTATKCVGATSWTLNTPRPPGTRKQMLFSGKPYAVVNKSDNVLHIAFVENSFGLENEDDGEAWWLRRSYTDCP